LQPSCTIVKHSKVFFSLYLKASPYIEDAFIDLSGPSAIRMQTLGIQMKAIKL
jgi:hypothetical protein